MDWLNYHHLHYFWLTAREGSIARAAEKLHLSQPTVSKQISQLEQSLGEKLFHRQGRGLVLTEAGRTAFHYAEQIFSLGRELLDTTGGRGGSRQERLSVGVPDFMPKLITYRLLAPLYRLDKPIELHCHESSLERLLAELAVHRFDVVLADAPASSRVRIRAYNHFLGDSGVTIFAAATLARRYRKGFPQSLDEAPMLLPTEGTELRRSLDQWFEENNLRPRVVGHIYDSALLKEFGHGGMGLFPTMTAIEEEVRRQYRVQLVGRIAAVRERFYAITLERQVKHPGVVALFSSAREELFTESS